MEIAMKTTDIRHMSQKDIDELIITSIISRMDATLRRTEHVGNRADPTLYVNWSGYIIHAYDPFETQPDDWDEPYDWMPDSSTYSIKCTELFDILDIRVQRIHPENKLVALGEEMRWMLSADHRFSERNDADFIAAVRMFDGALSATMPLICYQIMED